MDLTSRAASPIRGRKVCGRPSFPPTDGLSPPRHSTRANPSESPLHYPAIYRVERTTRQLQQMVDLNDTRLGVDDSIQILRSLGIEEVYVVDVLFP